MVHNFLVEWLGILFQWDFFQFLATFSKEWIKFQPEDWQLIVSTKLMYLLGPFLFQKVWNICFFFPSQILRSNTKRECKCHGVTGSCTLKTCWKELGAFDEVGSMLKENYNDAAKVSYMDDQLKENINRQLRAISNKDKRLVYLEASPNYCLRNDTVGSPGMLGRTCRSDEASTSKCRGLCETCRLKHKTVEQSKQIKCKCKFIWCCSVQCETCTSQYSLTTCAR